MNTFGERMAVVRKQIAKYDAVVIPLAEEYELARQVERDTMGKSSKKTARNTTAGTKEETPLEAFSRLATGRTNKAVKSISLIAQLTGSAYESTGVQKRAIVEALQASVDLVKDTFEGKAKASDKFRLPSG